MTSPTESPADPTLDATEPPSAGAGSGTPPGDRSPAEGGNRFFAWVRRLDLPRDSGWIGGVCAGIGARLGIDPNIVRGVAVVVAVLGGPVALLYAFAWFVLPDTTGRIHAEELGRGRFDPAVAGIAGFAVLSLLPVAQGFWYAGALYWGEPEIPAVGRVLWTIALITAAVLITIWVARRSMDNVAAVPSAEATSDAAEAAAASATTASETAVPNVANTAEADTTAPALPEPPAAPGASASASELAAWREQQDAWRRQRADYVAAQKATDRERRLAAARERNAVFLAQQAERRRIRRITHPRVGPAYVAMSLGLAVVVGSIAALTASADAAISGYETAVAFAAATLVLALMIVGAGAWRRRSGVLSFFSVLTVAAALVAAFLPGGRTLVVNGTYVPSDRSGSYVSLFGSVNVRGFENRDADVEIIDIWQGSGTVLVDSQDVTVRIEASTALGNVYYTTYTAGGESRVDDSAVSFNTTSDGRVSSTATLGEGDPDIIVRIWQGHGSIYLTELPPGSSFDAPSPSPSPIPSSPGPSAIPSPTPAPTSPAPTSPRPTPTEESAP